MHYRERHPPAPLADVVLRLWHLAVPPDGASGEHRVLPDGCTDLVVVARRSAAPFLTVRGPRADPLLIPVAPGDRFWGARLWPDAGGRVLGVPAADLVGCLRPAVDLLGAEAHGLAEGVVARADAAGPGADAADAAAELAAPLLRRSAAAPAPDAAVRLALLALHAADEAPDAATLAALVGLGPRQLQRRFRAATGLTPKTYARIRRLRRSLAHLLDGAPRPWSRVAATFGFADQSHLVAEFTRLAGARPAEVAAYVASIRHDGVAP